MKTSILRLAVKNSTRNRTRSLLTAGIIVGGTALFIISMSWLDGVWNQVLDESLDATGHVRVVTTAHASREALRPMDENIEDVAPVLEAVRSHPDVVAAYPIIETGATLTVGEEIGDVFGQVVGAPNAYFTDYLQADAKLVQGRWLVEGRQELVMGQKLVDRTGAKLGDEVVLLGSTQDGAMSPVKGTLVGIARAGRPTIDRRVFIDFPTAQWMLDVPNGSIKVIAYAQTYEGGADLARSLSSVPALDNLDVESWENLAPWDGQLGMMDAIRYILMLMVVTLAGLGVWNTMMMSVLERTREIGVLRALGMTRVGAVSLFVFEAAAIAVIGGAVGIVAGALPSLYMERVGFQYPESVMAQLDLAIPDTLYADLSVDIIWLAFLTALLTAVLGTIVPALRAASIQPDTAMRRS